MTRKKKPKPRKSRRRRKGSPAILDSSHNEETNVTTYILRLDNSFVLCKRGKMIVKRIEWKGTNASPQYRHAIYRTNTVAWKVADELNAKYNTDEYSVYEIKRGKVAPRSKIAVAAAIKNMKHIY